MNGSDKELWARPRTGDQDAFRVLFERYAERVYNYCFRRSADWAAAEDMISAVFSLSQSRADSERTRTARTVDGHHWRPPCPSAS